MMLIGSASAINVAIITPMTYPILELSVSNDGVSTLSLNRNSEHTSSLKV